MRNTTNITSLFHFTLHTDLKQDSSTRINLTTLELESEEEWLGGLQNFISEVTSSGIVASSSAGSIITTVSAENAVGEVRNVYFTFLFLFP